MKSGVGVRRNRPLGEDDSYREDFPVVSTRGKLNPSQKLHLLTSCQYADKLLSDIESAMAASQSKSPFPKFRPDLSPAQGKVVQDYIARVRAQLIRTLDSQGALIPESHTGTLHFIRATLGFMETAFDECRPKRMAGYGTLAETASVEIAGLVDEIQGIVSRLDSYLAQGESADLEKRLHRLEEAGSDVALVQALERVVGQHGLVEFRPALSNIIERLETNSFEIAVFGRVSCGKSSLLNHIVGRDLLPVGANPVTAVPTRLAYGAEPRATAWFADRKPEPFPVHRLAEFVSEQHNPANARHVTRIVVELPSPRLSEGVVYVDTPGLGSLATAGAAETKAYLPKCDLGVVLIDAASTLTHEDLATIQTLCDAGIPVRVLLSKADLLAPTDRDSVLQYVAGHIRSELGWELPVDAISVKAEYSALLETWLVSEILPLYSRHAELARQSLSRKIGALRLSVRGALQARLKRSGQVLDSSTLRDLETELRTASGKIAHARSRCIDSADAFRACADELIREAAKGDGRVRNSLEQAGAERAAPIVSDLEEAARHAGGVLAKLAQTLQIANGPEPDELLGVLKNMPRLDLSSLPLALSTAAGHSIWGRRWAAARLERRIRSSAGDQISDAVTIYARLLQAWVRRSFTELQAQFDSFADGYRAHLARLSADQTSAEDHQTLQQDLAALECVTSGRGSDGTAAAN